MSESPQSMAIHEALTAPEALDVFGCALTGRHLVEASAGTGKTWNLCALYLRLLLEAELPMEQILVVTFTKAATAELRERIRARMVQFREVLRSRQIHELHPIHPDAFIESLLSRLRSLGLQTDQPLARIEQALASFDEASIFTIHGFCQRALADAPFSAGQALSLDLIQDVQALQGEVVADFWREHVLSHKAPRALLEHLLQAKLTPDHLQKDLTQVLARPTSRLIWPDSPSSGPVIQPPDLLACFEQARDLWFSRQSEWQAGFAADREGLNGKKFGKDKFKLDQSIAAWHQWLSQSDPLLPMPDKDRCKSLSLLTPDGYTLNKGYSSALGPELLAATGALIQALEAQKQLGAALWLQLRKKAIAELPDRLNQIKRARQLQGFDDMLSNLHARLQADTSGALTQALQERFQAALIDEFQDTDPLQFEIFDRLFSSPQSRLFLLGDPKQAIYSFRNADLHTYLHARTTVAHEHTLNTNQRSTPELISALNHFFSANPQAFVLPGVQYRPVQASQRERPVFEDERTPAFRTETESPERAPLTVWHLPGPNPAQMKTRREAEQLSARACASEIASLLHGARQGWVRLDNRPLNGSDIAVLVRTHIEGERIRQALLTRGVACVSIAQESVHHSVDALELERVLEAVIDPGHPGRLRVALSTDLIGERAATLVALQHDDALLAHWSGRLHDWKNTLVRKGIGSMLRLLMRELDLAGRWLSRTDGERRMTNLLHLLERVQEAAHEHPQPAALLEWLKRERLEGGGAEAAMLRLESDRDLVKVLTIHKCKGLEFPVVFCPFLWTTAIAANNRDVGAGARYHDAEGQPVIDLRSSDERGADKAEVRSRIEAEIGAEHVRLTYVALTRAVHRLYLVCGQPLRGRQKNPTEKPKATAASTLLNWMVTGGADRFEAWGKATQDPVGIHMAWQTWAAGHAQHIQFCALPAPFVVNSAGQPHPVTPAEQRIEQPLEQPLEDPLEQTLEALPAPGFIGSSWRLGSYSSLVHGADAERSSSDHDQLARAALQNMMRERIEADDILHFPRGAQAGTCIHAIFEHIDFQAPGTWRQAIDQALRQTPPDTLPSRPGSSTSLWPQQLQQMLRDTLSTKLPSGFRMADIAHAHRLNELEFTLPVSRLQAKDLQDLLARHGTGIRLPAFETLQGYLKGFIDLVFMHDDRYYVLDWKSNHLGWQAQDYQPHQVAQAMADNHYDLQALLYCYALHRYLRLRLPGYRHERHFGGSVYLFVRGVRPAWRAPDDRVCGVDERRPSEALLDAMGQLLTKEVVAS